MSERAPGKSREPGDESRHARGMPESRHARGMKVRREVLGEAHVARAEARRDALTARFQDLITEGAWGTLWADETLPRATRSLITIALLAALGHDDELAMHLRAARRTGASADQIREALMHVAVYAGVPAANHAFAIAREVLAETNPQQE